MFIDTNPNELQFNPFTAIGKQWMLVTAVRDGRINTMTASWGGLGVLWNLPVATIYVRPQRFTHEFLEAADQFSLSFLPETCRDALTLCGKTSGRDTDKIAQAGLTAVTAGDTAYFAEAEAVMLCRKIYQDKLNPAGFLDAGIGKHYPQHDYHTIFIGEIQQCLIQQTK